MNILAETLGMLMFMNNSHQQLAVKLTTKRTPPVPRSQKKRTWKRQRKNKVKHEKDKEEEQEENKER